MLISMIIYWSLIYKLELILRIRVGPMMLKRIEVILASLATLYLILYPVISDCNWHHEQNPR